MEYTINELAKIAGVTTRTLRHYDSLDLLNPKYINSSGYRIYGTKEVNKLQEIMFYKELEMPLAIIKSTLLSSDIDREKKLQNHLIILIQKREQIDLLIKNVQKSIQDVKGEIKMLDKEKFEGFKQQLLKKNEEKFGKELRDKYADDIIELSNEKLKNMTHEQFNKIFSPKLNEALIAALKSGNPASHLAQKACDLHREWLCFFWPDGMYTKELHLEMGKMYVEDERFKKYYDDLTPGLAEFLFSSLKIYCEVI